MKRTRGRPSLFPGKSRRLTGDVTEVGSEKFEKARTKLAFLNALVNAPFDVASEMDSSRPSDGDVMEYLARGHAATRRHLAKRKEQDNGQ